MADYKCKPIPPISIEAQARFWSRVDVRGPNECWQWKHRCHNAGYGSFCIGHGTSYLAHRVAYSLEHNGIDGDLLVCHKCDNRPCCNPSHLFLGTHRDNLHDASIKGRLKQGSHFLLKPGAIHPRCLLATKDIDAIRKTYLEDGARVVEIAARFGVDISTITKALKGAKTIRAGTISPILSLRPRGERNHAARLIADDVLAIRAMYQKGVIGYNAIAKRFRLATHTVYSIVNRRTWTHI